MMSRGTGKGGATRGKGNSRRNSLSKSQKDNRSNQMNPNNSAHDSSRQAAGSPGRWRQRMDSKSASRIQAHADKTDMNQDFKARAQSAAEKNEDEHS